MLVMLSFTHAFLLLLSHPVLGWVAWYGSTQNDDAAAAHALATAATTQRNENGGSEQPAQQVAQLVQSGTNNQTALTAGAIDLIRLLNLSAGTPGVAQVPGPILNVPAFKLRPGFGLVQVPNPAAVTAALSSPAGFTLVFVYRQHRKSLGTLLSVHPPGRVTPWFQLASNLRTGQLLLHYRLTTDAKLHQNAWSLRPGSQAMHQLRTNTIELVDHARKGGGMGWTYVILSLNTTTNMLRLQLDCLPAREQPLAGTGGRGGGGAAAIRPRLHVPDDALVYFRQEPGFKKKFLGSMQVAKIYPYASTEHSDWACNGYQLLRRAQ